MGGMLLVSGQVWVLDQMRSKINSLGGLYIGLMTNSLTPSENTQAGSGITELSGNLINSGYFRKHCPSWYVVSGVDPLLSGAPVTITSSGDWTDVNGYFVALSAAEGRRDILWSETFPIEKQGVWLSGEQMIITPIYEQKYYGEI